MISAYRLCRSALLPSAKIKLEPRSEDGKEWVEYTIAKGTSEVSGQSIQNRLGPVTLVGAVYTELGGTVPVYMMTAWRGPLGRDGKPVSDAIARVKDAFKHMLAFMRFVVNRPGKCGLGPAAVRFFNGAGNFHLFGPEHSKQEGQAFTSFGTAGLVQFFKCWHSDEVQSDFCKEVSWQYFIIILLSPHFNPCLLLAGTADG